MIFHSTSLYMLIKKFKNIYGILLQLFYMILHSNLLQFYTVFASLATCFTMLLGKFDFTVIQVCNGLSF